MSRENYPSTTPSGYKIDVISTVEDLSEYAAKQPDYDLLGMADEVEHGRNLVRNAQADIQRQVDDAITDAKLQLDHEKLIANIEFDHEDSVVGQISKKYNLDENDTKFLRKSIRLINKYRDNGVDIIGMGQELANEAKKDIDISKSPDGKIIDLSYHFAFRNIDAIEGSDLYPPAEASVIDLSSRRTTTEA